MPCVTLPFMGSTLSNILLHIVFSTKHREPQILPDFQERLYEYMGGIVRAQRGIQLEIGGVQDHVHLLIRWRTDAALSDLMRQLKGGSSLWVHETLRKPFRWQDGYSAFSVSRSGVDALRHYIRTQPEHHQRMSFQDELRELLRRNGIEYDERYIWE